MTRSDLDSSAARTHLSPKKPWPFSVSCSLMNLANSSDIGLYLRSVGAHVHAVITRERSHRLRPKHVSVSRALWRGDA